MLTLWLAGLILAFSEPIWAAEKNDLLVVAVASQETDSYHRLIRSLNIYGYQYEIYGLGQNWSSTAEKFRVLRENLARYQEEKSKVILYVDAYNVIFGQGPDFLWNKFESFKPARIVFGAEETCWPDENLQYDYPFVDSKEKRFLNGQGFIGYASDIYAMIAGPDDIENDQVFFTKLFLQEREQRSIVLDKRADIFMNLNNSIDEIALPANGDEVYVHNSWTDSVPTVIHGNGPSKKYVGYLNNYIARSWSTTEGCLQAQENVIDITTIADLNQWPMVYLALFIEYPTPFLQEYFDKIQRLTYPKQRLGIFVHNQVEYHQNITEQTLKRWKAEEYKFVKYLNVDDDMTEAEARQQAIRECQEEQCDYLFVLDSIVHLDHPDTLIQLINYNRTIVAPMLLRPGQSWSNFWGDFSDDGFYQRSADYMDFVNYRKMGLFAVPHVAHSYLINGTFLRRWTPSYVDAKIDPDVKFCQTVRDAGFSMYISNEENFGHLIDPENFNTSITHAELFEVFNNTKDWKARYLHPDYQKALDANTTIAQPCVDVYWFPFLSEQFTQEFVTMIETLNQSSGATHHDARLAGSDENALADDIHLTQADFQEHWLFILRDVVQPIQQKVYTGYYSDPPKANLNFIVRFMPDRQQPLRPHLDTSVYAIHLALNDAETDFEGGGFRYVRQNCSVLQARRGWALMQPGLLTHLHEDLPVTKGKRDILISLIDS